MLFAALLAAALCALAAILLVYRPPLRPLCFLAALIVACGACVLAAAGQRQGMLAARYAAPPEACAEAFFSAFTDGRYGEASGMADGCPAFGLESTPDDEADAALVEALRESYVFRLPAEAATQGLRASLRVEYSALDLAALQRDTRALLLARLERLVAERPYREIYDEQGDYRPQVTDEVYLAAVRELLRDGESYRRSGTLQLSLRYDEALWHIVPDDALIDALGGPPGQLRSELHNGKSAALEGLVFIRKHYEIPETALAAPAPDPAGYGSSADPADVRAVIDGAAILLDGQETVWNEQIRLFPGTQFDWYYDDSILAICWKELIDGKCCTFAEVKIADGSQLRRKITDDVYDSRRREYASRMAEEVNAVVASNGDFYAFRPYGITVYQRQLYRCDLKHLDSCFITAGGEMLMTPAKSFRSREELESYLVDNDVLFSLAFGPILIRDGALCVPFDYPIGEIREPYSRSMLGTTGELHYLVMTINFDKDVFRTATLAQAAGILFERGCVQGFALDGGQTAEIWMNGRILNHIDFGTERPVSDILYFATALPERGDAS